jgi:hypothetical protein
MGATAAVSEDGRLLGCIGTRQVKEAPRELGILALEDVLALLALKPRARSPSA